MISGGQSAGGHQSFPSAKGAKSDQLGNVFQLKHILFPSLPQYSDKFEINIFD